MRQQPSAAEYEAHYRSLYEATPAMMHSIDVEGKIVSVSELWLKTLGYTRDEVVGRKSTEFLSEASRRYAAETVLPEFFRHGVCSDIPYQMLAKDGRVIDVLLSAIAERDDEGKITRSLAVIQDVTERRRIEQQTTRLLAEQKAILDNDLVGIVRVKDRVIVWSNPAFEKMLGYGPGELAGVPTRNSYPGDEAYQAFGAAAYPVIAAGGIHRAQLEQVRRDGKHIWVDISGTLLDRDSGESLWAMIDISERRHLEQAAAENERRMQALLDASPESTMLLDPEGRVLAINAVAAQRLGKTKDKMAGNNFFDYLPPELAKTRRDYLQLAVSSGEPQHMHDKRGSQEFENHVCPVADADGEVTSIAIYARDITAQQRTQRLDATFHRLDLMQLKWHMELSAIAQMFCEEIRPLFDLGAVTIGRAEVDGTLALVGAAEAAGTVFLEGVSRNCQRWDGEPNCCNVAGSVMRSGQMRKLSIDDPDCSACRDAAREAGIVGTLMVPLTLRDRPWGVLTFYAREQGLFDQLDFSPRLAVIASRLCMSLESALQQEWLKLMDTALASAGNAVVIADAKARITWANPSFERLSGYKLEEILGRTPKLFKSGAHEPAFYSNLWEKLTAGESWTGEMVNARRDGSRYTVNQTVTPLRNDRGEISHFVSIQEDISERKAADERIRHMANFDMLTDLPNRVMFFDRIGQAHAQARREGHSGALLFLDLDRFKEVNDKLGHPIGDLLLKSVAGRLQAQVRETDTVARLAGDEFTVTLPHVRDVQDAVLVARKIIEALSRPFLLDGNEVGIGVSIGAALFPEHGATVEQVVNAADDAMYMAKRAGRNTVIVYGAEA